MCHSSSSSFSETASCSGHCASCALASSEHLEQNPHPQIALTALRVFILPVLFGLFTACLAGEQTGLQLPAGAVGFLGATAYFRRIPGGRLL